MSVSNGIIDLRSGSVELVRLMQLEHPGMLACGQLQDVRPVRQLTDAKGGFGIRSATHDEYPKTQYSWRKSAHQVVTALAGSY